MKSTEKFIRKGNNMSDENIHNATAFDKDEMSAIIKVIGVGGGGCNAINYMYNQGVNNVSFAVCNTDKQALKDSPIDTKLVLGYEITKGLGAGDNPEVGRLAAEASTEDIEQMINDGSTKMVFITAGMGGGTGTGAGPVVAKIAKELGILTIGIVTIPFLFEGENKILKALDGAEEMRKYVDSLLIINNERLNEIYADLTFTNAFKKADDTLANAARSIAGIITKRGYINVDFKDVETTLKDSSTAIISTGEGEGENRVTKAINDALNSPLLKNSDISTSKRLLFFLHFNPNSENPLTMNEMSEINQFSAKLSRNIKIKWGASFDDELGDNVRMTILASGFDITVRERGNGEVITFSGSPEEPTTRKDNVKPIDQRLKEEYGTEKITKHTHELACAKYVVLEPNHFDDDEIISLIESVPAYNRDPKFKERLKKISAESEAPVVINDNNTMPEDESTTTIVF